MGSTLKVMRLLQGEKILFRSLPQYKRRQNKTNKIKIADLLPLKVHIYPFATNVSLNMHLVVSIHNKVLLMEILIYIMQI